MRNSNLHQGPAERTRSSSTSTPPAITRLHTAMAGSRLVASLHRGYNVRIILILSTVLPGIAHAHAHALTHTSASATQSRTSTRTQAHAALPRLSSLVSRHP